MRINTIIATTIFAATSVSAAALPVPKNSVAVREVTETTEVDAFAKYFPKGFDPAYFDEVAKRDASPGAPNGFGGWTWRPWRPFGSPIGKRNAEAFPKVGPETRNK